ncbi:MAG: TlpA family protein disulfide reductase [Gemmatimonadetes bacterium]|nr:TlpA family protein disulfide reductase [Gemmatimonadota bacterium]
MITGVHAMLFRRARDRRLRAASPHGVGSTRARRRLITAWPLLAVLAACEDGERLRAASDEAPLIGQPLPSLTLTDLGRQPVDLERYGGRAMLVNLWATWCIPCLEEMPELEELHERYDDADLAVVGISIDHVDPELVVAFLEENEITYPSYLADGMTLIEALGLAPGIPHTLLVDAEGTVRGYWRGRFRPFEPNTAALIERVVTGGA